MVFTQIRDDRGYMKVNLIFVLLVVIVSLAGFKAAAAESVEVPVDELARESVMPRFDNSVSVKNRNVTTEGRIDIGLFAGMALTEPIANTTKLGIEGSYHFNEVHALGLFFNINMNGLSRDAEGLKNDFGLDFSRAPQPQNTMMLEYAYSPFYGKLSLTKEGVINTTIYGSLDAGAVKYQHKTYPAIAVGVGERFYFTKSLSLKLDLKLFAHNAPIPFKANALKPTDPVPAYSDFAERLTYTTNLQLGLNYLF